MLLISTRHVMNLIYKLKKGLERDNRKKCDLNNSKLISLCLTVRHNELFEFTKTLFLQRERPNYV